MLPLSLPPQVLSELERLKRPAQTRHAGRLGAHPQHIQEAPVLHQLWVDVKQLGNTHSSGLAHIRVVILQQSQGQTGFRSCANKEPPLGVTERGARHTRGGQQLHLAATNTVLVACGCVAGGAARWVAVWLLKPLLLLCCVSTP